MNWRCNYNYTCDVCKYHHVDKSVNKVYCLLNGKEVVIKE